MTEAKHGPVHERDTSGQAPIGQEKPGVSVETANFILERGRDVYRQLKEARALNSELAAALKTLSECSAEDLLDDGSYGWQIARAAIAKATMTAQQTERTQV